MRTRYDELIDGLREAARPERPAPAAMRDYLEKVRLQATGVSDEDIAQLRDRGFSEDEIFEHTVATAVAAGLERLETGLRVLR